MRTLAPRAALLIVAVGLAAACRLDYAGGARAVSPTELDPGWKRATATPIVKQEREMDCGLAALAMVAGAWGQRWSVDEMARELPPGRNGVKLGALRDLARKRGLEAYAIAGGDDDLARELGAGRPVLLGLTLPYDQQHNLNHYEVAVAYDPRSGSVVTIDPATGKYMSRSHEVLDLEWKVAGYATLVVVGNRTVGVIASPRWPSLSSTTPR